MKVKLNKRYIFIISLLLYCVTASAQSRIDTVKVQTNAQLKGNVKEVVTITNIYSPRDTGYVTQRKKVTCYNNDGKLSSVYYPDKGKREETYTYDQKGKLILGRRYNERGKVSHSSQYRYNKQNKINKTIVKGEGYSSEFNYEYDGLGRLISINRRVTKGKEKGKLDSKSVYIYDGRNNIIQEESYNSKNKYVTTTYYTYDEKGDCIGEIYYYIDRKNDKGNGKKYKRNSEGQIIETTIITNGESDQNIEYFTFQNSQLVAKENKASLTEWKYDLYGNETEYKVLMKGINSLTVKKMNYVYDEKGNWTEKTFYNGEIVTDRIKRVIEYY